MTLILGNCSPPCDAEHKAMRNEWQLCITHLACQTLWYLIFLRLLGYCLPPRFLTGLWAERDVYRTITASLKNISPEPTPHFILVHLPTNKECPEPLGEIICKLIIHLYLFISFLFSITFFICIEQFPLVLINFGTCFKIVWRDGVVEDWRSDPG